MKQLWNKYLVPLLILVTLVACETDADMVKLPEFKQKLVITAFISPSDRVSYFRVTSNRKIYGELHTEEPLGLLSGSISDGLNEVLLDTCKAGLKLSHEKMQIQYGKTYKLRISSEKGLNAEAECTVPAKENFSMEADTFSVLKEQTEYGPDQGNMYRSINLNVRFSDPPGEENFYRILGTYRGYSKNYTMTGGIRFNKEFIRDNGIDGKSIVESMDEENSYFLSLAEDSLFLRIYLFNTEKSYFLFHKSLKDYNNGENPFSEATPVYSNINGGFGVFTSYTIDSLAIRLK